MNNKYIFLRHGESVSNFRDIICSSIQNGTSPEYGLTKTGIEQVRLSSKVLKKELKNEDIVIFCSPFTRALQTALIVKNELDVNNFDFFVSMNLKERGFEKFELQSSKEYSTVWENDNNNLDTKGIETCKEVSNRVKELFIKLEKEYKNKTIILVSHGDTIMIARTVFLDDDAYNHRNYNFIKNAECLVFAN